MTEPARPLGSEGRRLWNEWVDRADPDVLLTLCEATDERQMLRLKVLRENVLSDRVALRALDAYLAEEIDAFKRAAAWDAYARQEG